MLNVFIEKWMCGFIFWDYLMMVDYKKIVIFYLIVGGFFFFVGGIEVMFIRIQFVKLENVFFSV